MSAIIYLLQVSACLAIFYGFYYLLLNRLTFFSINRLYLLGTLVISFIIPLLTIPVKKQYTVTVMPKLEDVVIVSNNLNNYVASAAETSAPITWMQLLQWGYIAIAATLLIHLTLTLISFFVKLKNRKISRIGNVQVLRGDKNLPNGSFLNYIFLNDDELSADELQQIVAHEMLHVKLLHSADRIIAKMAQIILWFNPFVYLYARSIEENHEFQVDREMAKSTNKIEYADLLVHLSVANQCMLYHSFSKVPLKKRITMLFNKPSAKTKKVIYLLVLPVVVISCLAFAKVKPEDIKHFSLAKTGKNIINAIQTGQDNIIKQLDRPVPFPVVLADAYNIKSININTAIQHSAIPAIINDTTHYGVFEGVSKNTKVIINGKQYPSDILYEISTSNVVGSIAIKADSSRHLTAVELKTKNGEIIYMTAIEKENLRIEQSIPPLEYYTRVILKKNNGDKFERVKVRLASGSWASSDIPLNGKVGFLINDKLYNETEFKKLLPTFINTFRNQHSISTAEAPSTIDLAKSWFYKGDVSTYDALFGIGTNVSMTVTSTPGTLMGLDSKEKNNLRDQYSNDYIKYTTDTTEYNARPYNTGPNDMLIDILPKMPGFDKTDNEVFNMGKKIERILINNKEFNGTVMQSVKNLPVAGISRIQIIYSTINSQTSIKMNVITTTK